MDQKQKQWGDNDQETLAKQVEYNLDKFLKSLHLSEDQRVQVLRKALHIINNN